MKTNLQNKNLSVRTNLQAGTWWVKQCLKDHPDGYTCCVPGSTPGNCKSCLNECIVANSGPDYDENGLYNCTMNKKCFG